MTFDRNTRHALHCQRSPPTTARLCLQRQPTGNNPPLALQIYMRIRRAKVHFGKKNLVAER